MKIAVVAIFKNEAPFLREWIAYHRCVGVDEFVLYDNESTDGGTDTVRHWPGITVHPWPHRPGQIPAYSHFHANYATRYDWAAFIDLDEFINPLAGDLHTVLDRAGSHSAMLLNWLMFGPSGHERRPPGLVIESYSLRLPSGSAVNRHPKSIVRMSAMTEAWTPHQHRVRGDVCNALGETVPNGQEWLDPSSHANAAPCHANAVINHYYTRSRDDWALKLIRGRADTDDAASQRHASTFDSYAADATEFDDRIFRWNTAVRRELWWLDRGSREQHFQGLIMDIGVSEGNDTAYYLAKGFRVIAVEADPTACKALLLRFDLEINSGALILLNFAAGAKFGGSIKLFAHSTSQHISSLFKRPEVDPAGYSEHSVLTIDWRTLLAQAGMPRYLKIDIEGQEEQFLAGLVGCGALPEFVSIEAYSFRSCEMLFDMGYRRFKLVDQNPPGGFRLPARQMEGVDIEFANFAHSSGPFGLDLFQDGDWLDFNGFTRAWSASQQQVHRTWFDCHAWRPN